MNPFSASQCFEAYKNDYATSSSAKKEGNTLHEASGSIQPEFKKDFFEWKMGRATQQKGGGRNDVGWYSSLVSKWDTLHWNGNATIPGYATCRQLLLRYAAIFAEVLREISEHVPTGCLHSGTPQLQQVSVMDDLTLESGDSLKILSEFKPVNFEWAPLGEFRLGSARNRRRSCH